VTGRTRWARNVQGSASDLERKSSQVSEAKPRFWDYRPFTRIVQSFRAVLHLKDYIRINQLEGFGHKREDARFMLEVEKKFLRAADYR
jgi:hypothetical protein